jgi:hypothetical protein
MRGKIRLTKRNGEVRVRACRCTMSIRARSTVAGIRPWKASLARVLDSSTRAMSPLASTRGCTGKTGGRYPSILGGASTAPLMTTGARSGQPREHQITYFHDGQDAIAIASNFGGAKHPQWYYNLKAHPERVRRRDFRGE